MDYLLEGIIAHWMSSTERRYSSILMDVICMQDGLGGLRMFGRSANHCHLLQSTLRSTSTPGKALEPMAVDCSKCCCYYFLVSFFLIFIFLTCDSLVQAEDAATLQLKTTMTETDSLEWPMTMSLYAGDLGDDEDSDEINGRRSLFWHRVKYYISYGALAANRIPCPPRSGRSYYTHNCYFATGPVHPYTRGCSAITRCRS
ncbi:hypothetical protein ACH5RR_011441 [Cinchona calisaya]|uniref:Uncharacterized protein n=1 Tax=Cinchona calisaya TaxID=153742 RepID=A0ABD3A8G8_9GENT